MLHSRTPGSIVESATHALSLCDFYVGMRGIQASGDNRLGHVLSEFTADLN